MAQETDKQGIDTLSAEETKYFESGGDDGAPAGDPPPPPDDSPPPEGDGADTGQTPDPAPKANEGKKQPSGKTVAIEALHESRAREKEIRDQLAEERRQRAIIDQRTAAILETFNRQNAAPQQQQQQQPETPAIPAIDQDPVGHIIGRLEEVNKKLGDVAKTNEQRTVADQQVTAIRNLQNTAIAMEEEFKKVTPDYDDAVNHLRATQEAELAEQGYTPQEIRNFIAQQALGAAARAIQQGKNPGQVLYAMAKVRGWAPKPAAPVQPAAPAAPTPVERVANIQRGQNEGRSLSQSRGTAPAPLTSQRLLEMSNEEFDKAMATAEGRALMGS